jgi:hypothetical protein
MIHRQDTKVAKGRREEGIVDRESWIEEAVSSS